MPDPICRWRNPSILTLCNFVILLPKQAMTSDSARQYISQNENKVGMGNFFRTPYQAAKQQALFYETDDGMYIPRFDHVPSIEEAAQYLEHWITLYYFPNPYARGFDEIQTPKLLVNSIFEYLNNNGGSAPWEELKHEVFQCEIGNDDIIRNSLVFCSKLCFDGENIQYCNGVTNETLLLNGCTTVEYDRDDKVAFFNHFGRPALLNQEQTENETNQTPIPYSNNRIFFGAPGTGKSHLLEQERTVYFDDEHTERVTFYPTYSYSQFVGTYKPIMVGENITYSYVPGPFIRSYIRAVQNPGQKYLLIVEELNRANAPAVFGDVFQLMDRLPDGTSEYPVAVSEDLMRFLSRNGIEQDTLSLPPNLYIWTTMNSADQGVFPLDTAFKRRWDFDYMGINSNEEVIESATFRTSQDGNRYSWNSLRREINKKLIACKVNEDKLLGPFFIKPSVFAAGDDTFITTFKAKVIMYLFEDAARQVRARVFPIENATTYSEICQKFDEIGAGIFGITLSPVDENQEESVPQEQ